MTTKEIKQAIKSLSNRYYTMSMCINKEQCLKENKAIDLSIQALQNELKKLENKPLAVEELKNRIGKPVWTDDGLCNIVRAVISTRNDVEIACETYSECYSKTNFYDYEPIKKVDND